MFTINRELLARELALLLPVSETKGTIPVLSNVLMEFKDNLKLTATDLDVTLVSEMAIPVLGKLSPVSYCLPLRQLATLSRLFEGPDVTFTEKPNERIEVKCGTSKHLLTSVPPDSFPTYNAVASDNFMSVDGDALREAVRRVLPCASKQEGRWAVQGVSFETVENTLQIVATNGHRLGVASVPFTGESIKALVPVKALKSLLSLEAETVKIKADDNGITFECDPRSLTSRLTIGEFPNWKLIVPKSAPYSVEIPVNALRKALGRISVTRETKFVAGSGSVLGGAKLTFTKNELIAETRQSDQGQSEEPVPVTSNLNGSNIEMGINPDYLSDFLSLAGETVTCELRDPNSQIKFSDGNFQYVVMPSRL